MLWGDRVIIPETLREILLKDIHAEHMGIVCTKQLARLYLLWPRLDAEIEDTVKVCTNCQEHSEITKSSDVWVCGHGQQVH